jgi:hypothetical protein
MLHMMRPQSNVIEPAGNIAGPAKYVECASSIASGSTQAHELVS